MEFEFVRRRVTKEDIRELIFREILEYHPQLLKDYKSGADRATFIYPRSTVHSRAVHPQDHQQSNCRDIAWSSQDVPQRVPTAKPGKVVGSVMPYDRNIGLKAPYDPRRSTSMLTAFPHPSYYIHRSISMSSKVESTFDSTDGKMDYVLQHQVTISASSNSSPFFQHLSAASGIGQGSDNISKVGQSIANEVFQSRKVAAFGNGIVAASNTNPHHHKVGAVQFGMSGSGMY